MIVRAVSVLRHTTNISFYRRSFIMNTSMKKRFSSILCALAFASALTVPASAQSWGNSKCGASNVEVLQVRYNGAAWVYSGSGKTWCWFKYSRNGRTLMQKTARYNQKVTGSVWDDLIHWDDAHTTKFNYNWG